MAETRADAEEIAGFLRDHAPDRFKALVAASGIPEEAAFSRRMLGPGQDNAPESSADRSPQSQPVRNLLVVQAKAAIAAAEELSRIVDSVLRDTKARLARANSWETFGGVLALVGATSAVAVLLPEQPDRFQAQVASGIGIAGSLVTLLVKTMRKTLSGSGDSISKPLSELQDLWVQVAQSLPILGVIADSGIGIAEADAKKEITGVNDLLRKVRQRLMDFGQ